MKAKRLLLLAVAFIAQPLAASIARATARIAPAFRETVQGK